ncbi:uncharacterized protein [Diadema setosum]|uniref:uncharacterized protein n=1 Tax=Diadema setosum TaxID=31175 RepID=UPI003B3A475C
MSELFGIAGAMLKNCSTNRLLSQDIIHEARGQMMRPYAVQSAEVDLAPTCALSGNLLLHSMEQRNYIRLLEHRLVAFAQRMGEHRVCETAHMVFERMEAAWQLQQEACCIVGTKYDNVLDKLMILASDVGLDIAGASNSPDDIFAGLTNSWQEARENAKKIATALDIETANIQVGITE